MPVLTQIYGVTDVSDAIAVDRLHADYIGVVVDEGIETWDSVDAGTAAAIAGAVKHAKLVGLSLSTDLRRIGETVVTVQPSVLHLARAHEMSTAALEALRQVEEVEFMLTVPVHDDQAMATAERLAPLADYLLLDSRDPSSGVVGATGLTHDWSLSAAIVAAVPCPVFLAGGLGPDNVADAIRAVRPAGVDSETHTSRTDDRRRKDLAKVEAFIALAQSVSAVG